MPPGEFNDSFAGIFASPTMIGLGMGLAIAASISTATLGVATDDSGVAPAAVSTMQQVRVSLGTAVFSSLATGVAAASTAGEAAATVTGYTAAFAGGAVVLAAGAVASAFLPRSGTRAESTETAMHV